MNKIIKQLSRPLAAIVVLLLMILWMAGYFDEKVVPGMAAGTGIEKFRLLTVTGRTEPVFESVPASVEASQATTISARILARIEKIHVHAGNLVTMGQPLVELEKSDLQSRSARAQAQVGSAQARLAEAQLALARATDLAAKNLIARSDLDRARSNHDALLADHASAEQALNEARSALDFAVITAPISGRIVDRFAEPGDTAQPGKPLLSLYNPSSLRIEANIREQLAVTLEEGQIIEVSIPSKNLVVTSRIEEMVPAGNVGSRSFMVKARLNSVDGLLPGMYAQLKVPAGVQSLLLVPAASIEEVGQLEIVSVVSGDHLERRFVRTGKQLADGLVEVISGLNEGDQVVDPRP